MSSYTAEQLKATYDALVEGSPSPQDRTDAIWAGLVLMTHPEHTAQEVQDEIKKGGTVILRENQDLPKLEKIVESWRKLLP